MANKRDTSVLTDTKYKSWQLHSIISSIHVSTLSRPDKCCYEYSSNQGNEQGVAAYFWFCECEIVHLFDHTLDSNR